MVATLASIAAVAALLPTASVDAQEQPQRHEIGVDDDTIRVAVVADVDNPALPGIFQGSVDGVRAGAKYLNQRGGVAGRRVEVDFYDSRLSADETRTALLRACENDFAVVGTTSVFLSNIEPLVECVDGTGKRTGLPDVPIIQTEFAHQCSPVSYALHPFGLVCSTLDEPMKRFDVTTGPQEYFLRRFGDLHGPFVLSADSKSAVNASLPFIAAYDEAGLGIDDTVRVSGADPQAAYTPIAQSIKQNGSTYAAVGIDYKANLFLRREAKLQGVDTVRVWDCPGQCYDQRLIAEGGDDVEGQFATLFALPFEEANRNKTLARFLRLVGGREKANAYSAAGFATMLLFGEVVGRVVDAHGEDGLTRARFLDEIAQIRDFDAGGMYAPVDVGSRKRTTCFAIVQVQDGEWVRVFPRKKGTFDCASKLTSVEIALE